MDNLKFGKFIAEARKNNGLTQAELAEKLNVTDKTVSKWECGRGFPDIKLIETLAKNLQVSVAEIMQCEKAQDETMVSVDWFHRSLFDNLAYIFRHFAHYEKQILLVILCIFCLAGTVLAPYTGTGIFEYIREFGYYNGFFVYELGVGIIIWSVFVKGGTGSDLRGFRKSKRRVTYLFGLSCIVNVVALVNVVQILIAMFQALNNGELYHGMDAGQTGPHLVKMIRLSLDLGGPEGGWTARLILQSAGMNYLSGIGIMVVMGIVGRVQSAKSAK